MQLAIEKMFAIKLSITAIAGALLVCALTLLAPQHAHATAINIWKHRYPFYGGYGYYGPWGWGGWGGYGGYGGGYGGGGFGGIGVGIGR